MAEPHALLAGRYRLVREVGRGGMGVVWEAWDERLERPVAVKELRPQPGLTPEEAELAKNRAMREARITARLHHRNAVPVFDVVEHEGQPCLIMQFLPSVPLSAVLREGGPLGVHEAARFGAEVASALAAAHQLGIVHRDVKPGNILIADDGTALISDFGISHALGDATLTSTGLVHGTPAYLAPEVARGADSSTASDVFSLGATLYACLEGAPPFGTDSNSIALLYRVASGEFTPPERAGLLTPVLVQMLRFDPAARPSMREAAARLAAAEAGDAGAAATLPLTAVPAGPPATPETGTTRVRPAEEQPTVAATRATAVAPAAVPLTAPSSVPPTVSATVPPNIPPAGVASVLAPPPPDPQQPPRRRRGAWLLVAAALVGLVVLAAALLTGQLGGDRNGAAAGPATAGSTATAGSSKASKASKSPKASKASKASTSPTAAADPSSDGTTPSGPPSGSASPSDPPSPSATRTSRSPSASATAQTGTPTAAELEDAITGYYALLPGNTDQAWTRLTAAYQRSPSGGRSSYEQFWKAVDRVSVSNVDASPPSRVVATITFHQGSAVEVDRTTFRLVREDGILKIAASSNG